MTTTTTTTARSDIDQTTIDHQMGSIYETVIRDEWMKAEEDAGARELRMPMEHNLRSAFAAFAHLPVHQHAEQTRRILAGIMAGTSECVELSKLECLIVSAGDWIPAARDGDRLDAPKTAAVKQAVQDWGVIETSREVVRHREEKEELHAEVVEDEPRGSLAMATPARTTVEVRPRMSSMDALTAMVREQD